MFNVLPLGESWRTYLLSDFFYFSYFFWKKQKKIILVRFAVVTAMAIKSVIFWDVTPCSLVEFTYVSEDAFCLSFVGWFFGFNSEYSDSTFLRHAVKHLPDLTSSHPRKLFPSLVIGQPASVFSLFLLLAWTGEVISHQNLMISDPTSRLFYHQYRGETERLVYWVRNRRFEGSFIYLLRNPFPLYWHEETSPLNQSISWHIAGVDDVIFGGCY
jgi:hypothetical protein